MIETLAILTAILTANTLFIWGLNACFDEGMIFGKVKAWMNRPCKEYHKIAGPANQKRQEYFKFKETMKDADDYVENLERLAAEATEIETKAMDLFLKKRIPEWLQKPLYSCPVCMASIWGSLGYFSATLALFGWSWSFVALWPVYVVCLAGVSAIIIQLSPEWE